MTEIFVTRKLSGSKKYIKCIKCNIRRRIDNSHICYYCHGINSLISNSGNINIDNFIKGTQSLSNRNLDPLLQWVPFEEFKDLEKIGQGGFSQIFKATWKINKRINYKGTVKRSSKQTIVLKVLNNSQNVDTVFLNE
ncbi:2431_t:CDS:1, partial [Diversispora eburnea]